MIGVLLIAIGSPMLHGCARSLQAALFAASSLLMDTFLSNASDGSEASRACTGKQRPGPNQEVLVEAWLTISLHRHPSSMTRDWSSS